MDSAVYFACPPFSGTTAMEKEVLEKGYLQSWGRGLGTKKRGGKWKQMDEANNIIAVEIWGLDIFAKNCKAIEIGV